MLKKRIIPCLDIKDGRTVKGVNFENIIDAGDPIELAKIYVDQGADELMFLDITATVERRKTLISLVTKIATEINIPFTVGGGIQSIADVRDLLNAGADKISINSAAVRRPKLIQELADEYGTQCIVVAIDTKRNTNTWKVYINGGRTSTDHLTVNWVKEVEQLGAGEILLTSMNNDGEKSGYAIDIIRQVSQVVRIPVIASGGAGSLMDFVEVFEQTEATGALAASIFHYREVSIRKLKNQLKTQNITVR